MSMWTILHSWYRRPADPLMKLVLVFYGNSANEDTGEFALDWDRLVDFCCAPSDDVGAAFAQLMTQGLVEETEKTDTYRLGGYEAPERSNYHVYRKQVIGAGLRRRVFERDGNKCKHCGTSENLSVDHIIAERIGGTLDFDNLQTLCRLCNVRKGWKPK